MNAFYCNLTESIAHILYSISNAAGTIKEVLAALHLKERARTAKNVVKILALDGWRALCVYVSEGGFVRKLVVSGIASGVFVMAAYVAAQASRQLLRGIRPHLLMGALAGCAAWNAVQFLRKKATRESAYASLLVAVTVVLGRAILDAALGVLLITMARQLPASFVVGMAAFNLAVFFYEKRTA